MSSPASIAADLLQECEKKWLPMQFRSELRFKDHLKNAGARWNPDKKTWDARSLAALRKVLDIPVGLCEYEGSVTIHALREGLKLYDQRNIDRIKREQEDFRAKQAEAAAKKSPGANGARAAPQKKPPAKGALSKYFAAGAARARPPRLPPAAPASDAQSAQAQEQKKAKTIEEKMKLEQERNVVNNEDEALEALASRDPPYGPREIERSSSVPNDLFGPKEGLSAARRLWRALKLPGVDVSVAVEGFLRNEPKYRDLFNVVDKRPATSRDDRAKQLKAKRQRTQQEEIDAVEAELALLEGGGDWVAAADSGFGEPRPSKLDVPAPPLPQRRPPTKCQLCQSVVLEQFLECWCGRAKQPWKYCSGCEGVYSRHCWC